MNWGIGMIRVAICDDEKYIVEEIQMLLIEWCEKCGIEVEVNSFLNGKDLIKYIESGKTYDLIYLDIQMDQKDGIQTAKDIRNLDKDVYIIYVSGYDFYIEDIFDVSATNFIRKPIKKDRFQKLLYQIYEKISNRVLYFECTIGSEIKRITFHEIVFFESIGRIVKIHLRDGEVISFYGKLKDIEKEISNKNLAFIRVHQSFLVNFGYITNRARNELKVTTGELIPISRDRQKEFLMLYTKYMGREIYE